MGRRAAAAALLVLLYVGLAHMGPWLGQHRQAIVSTPSLGGVIGNTPVTLKPGAQACVAPVPFGSDLRSLQVNPYAARRAQPLDVTIDAPGYHAAGRIAAEYPTGVATGASAVLSAPPRDLVGRVCVRNAGTAAVTLAATNEARSIGLARTTVDGRPTADGAGIALSLRGGDGSALARLSTIVDHAAALTGFVPAWLAWLVLVSMTVGVPLGLLALLAVRRR
jgi:hypothetical protein